MRSSRLARKRTTSARADLTGLYTCPHTGVALAALAGGPFAVAGAFMYFATITEVPDHRWFVGVQFHPELKSRPNRPHPLFASFVEAAARRAGYLDPQGTPAPKSAETRG